MSYDRSKPYSRRWYLETLYTDSDGGSYGPFYSVNGYFRTDFDIGSGVRGWKDLIARGWDASSSRMVSRNNAESGSRQCSVSYVYDPPGVTSPDVNGNIEFSGDFAGILCLSNSSDAGPSPIVEGLSRQLAQKFRAAVRNAARAWESGTFAGELVKTVREVKRPLQGIRNLAKGHIDRSNVALNNAISRRRRGQARSSVLRDVNHAIADSYLSYKFGVEPLSRDLDDAIDALDRLNGNAGLKEEVWSTVRGQEKQVVTFGPVYDPGFYPMVVFDLAFRQEAVEKFRCSGAVTLEPHDVTPPSGASVLGLAPADFVSTAWNLLPWSFLVDYAYDISGMIDSITSPTSQIRWYSSSLKQTVKVVASPVFRSDLTDTANYDIRRHSFTVSNPGSVTATLESLMRGKIDLGDYQVLPRFRLPSLDSQPGKWLNVAALLAGQGIARNRFQTLISS